MIRVAFGSVPKDSGTFTFYRTLRPELLKRGVDLRCLTVGKFEAALVEDAFIDDGCSIIGANVTSLKRQAQLVTDWCVEQQIDIVIGINSPGVLSAIPHLPAHMRVVSRCANGFDEGYQVAMLEAARLSRVVALVPRLLEDLVTSYNCDPSITELIPNGHSPQRFAEARVAPRGHETRLRLGYLGRLEHNQKGVLHIPKVLEELDRSAFEYTLDIAGKGRDQQTLQKRLGPQIGSGKVNFRGSLTPDEIPDFLSQIDVLLFPSHFEGCPNALIEAMMAGVVPVCWKLPGITDFVVQDGVSGTLNDIGDRLGMAHAISTYGNDRNALRAASKAASETAQERFSVGRCADAYASLFEEVMAEPSTVQAARPWSRFSPDPMFQRSLASKVLSARQRERIKGVLNAVRRRKTEPHRESGAEISPIRVHHIINSAAQDRGGAERLVVSLHRKLIDAGLDSNLLALERCDLTSVRRARTLDFTSPYQPGVLFQLLKHTRRFSADDVVHVHLFPSSGYASLLARFGMLKGQLVFTEHSTSNRRRNTFVGKIIDTVVYRPFSKVVAISDGVESELTEARPSLKNRTTVIENGCILNFERPPERVAKKEVTIVSVGRLSPAKNYPIALEAVAKLSGNVRYKIAGDGPELPKLQKCVAEYGLGDRVEFRGFVEDISAFLTEADIFLIPSAWEGFGLAAVEAMNAGLPVVASNIPGLKDVVGEHGETALLVDPSDTLSITNELASLVANPGLRTQLGQRAAKRSLRFNIERMVDAHIELYREVREAG